MATQVSLYLDTRRSKGDNGNMYPVKIRVWDSLSRKAKIYPANTDATQTDFEKAWLTQKTRKEFKELRIKLDAILGKANKIVQDLSPFTFEQFEKKLSRKSGESSNILYQYELIIADFKKKNQLGTASSYQCALNSIEQFLLHKNGRTTKRLTFFEISSSWLQEYETYMIKEKGRSHTTLSIYVRTMRALFNLAISNKDIENDFYPFGKRKYKIPASRNIKKALSKEQLKKLFDLEGGNPEQVKAKHFWFFSYACNGMNIKDIAQLKFSDMEGETMRFFRAKTITTSKTNLKPIIVYLNDFTKMVLEKYANKKEKKDDFVFPIINAQMSSEEQRREIQNFTRFINQHMKLLCKKNELPSDISTYWARHSFATHAVRSGASMEFIQESLGHGNLATTMNYFAGFEEETKKEFANKIMEF
jgi:site-specific recombinase XerD